uniref:CHCH domain-containing protein n=1 Tax=Salvator merianae TaxID=96440 RepID=A0A8D0B2R7_SALMN
MAIPPPPAWVTRLGEFKKVAERPRVKFPRALVLADKVSNRSVKQGEATCITEMTLMMACWKQNEFSDSACSKEVQTFLDCVAKAEEEHKRQSLQESMGQSKTLDSKQINKLLKRFPNITHRY